MKKDRPAPVVGMKIHRYPGFFIDIEGLDGSGSSLQVERVAKLLKKEGLRVYTTKEPSRGPIGKLVRSALKGEFNSLPPASVQLLFAADRGRHLHEEIIPRLEKGQTVITDRYAWSSIAYGSVELAQTWLLDLNKNFILPDLTILVDVPPEICARRITRQPGGLELFEEEEKLALAQEAYHSLATKHWAYIVVVNGEQPLGKVTEAILKTIKRQPKFKQLLSLKRRRGRL